MAEKGFDNPLMVWKFAIKGNKKLERKREREKNSEESFEMEDYI